MMTSGHISKEVIAGMKEASALECVEVSETRRCIIDVDRLSRSWLASLLQCAGNATPIARRGDVQTGTGCGSTDRP